MKQLNNTKILSNLKNKNKMKKTNLVKGLIVLLFSLSLLNNAFSQGCSVYTTRVQSSSPPEIDSALVYVITPNTYVIQEPQAPTDYTRLQRSNYRVYFWADAAHTIPVTGLGVWADFRYPSGYNTNGQSGNGNPPIFLEPTMVPFANNGTSFYSFVAGTNYIDDIYFIDFARDYLYISGNMSYDVVDYTPVSINLRVECPSDFGFGETNARTICVNSSLDLATLPFANGPASSFAGLNVTGTIFSSPTSGVFDVIAERTISGKVYQSLLKITVIDVDKTITKTASQVCEPNSITVCAVPGAVSYIWTDGTNSFPSSANNCLTLNSPGSASFYAVIDNGVCVYNSDATSVTINPLPVNTLNAVYSGGGTSITICCDEQAVGTSYQWYLNNVLITGATSRCFSTSTSGTYNCRMVSSFGCPRTSDDIVFTTTLSINKISLEVENKSSSSVVLLGKINSDNQSGSYKIVLQKSSNGSDFVDAQTKLFSSGPREQSTLRFIESAVESIIFYRLMSIENSNGRIVYSDVIKVSGVSNNDIFYLRSNPVNEVVSIRLFNGTQANASIVVLDNTGRKVLSAQKVLNPNIFTEINVSKLTPGVYTISINYDNKRLSKLFIKL